MTETPFAYSLAHAESGWTWRILDADGETVASGMDCNQSSAQAAVEATMQRVASEQRV
jgi:hypothetical protein